MAVADLREGARICLERGTHRAGEIREHGWRKPWTDRRRWNWIESRCPDCGARVELPLAVAPEVPDDALAVMVAEGIQALTSMLTEPYPDT